ncbi:putative S-adenosyl-L-methionine-dependent methyltransferase [Helianthus annuus]|uniref:S-adenosyl-L-methionine-dependent methyltransferase n=1 Tax=Helianthus annuus TaxID=4232 RepID=A0A251T0K9_HELAN|nr:uncharacterized protein LOC110894503 isoform X1 [Helianthus annuus]KAF5819712.1 putative S-adenosyl-L-methionine-dependent methyltransferase [Helianthus annuus]KAJ0619844.1 putative S-adenosyl-L-methionine-dependent methyltransferase [Helianthus annuus]KAJ0787279.1 putative S-adenosyl-L-methionine-dependent methyltransferase [Helianthus annuus]KAJ0952942.1 putative S-adenosyl-L-methionine-dependent methyltransferase [Helianthus annuus]
MGKNKKQRNQHQNQRNRKDASYYLEDNEQQSYPLTQPPNLSDQEQDSDDNNEDQNPSTDNNNISNNNDDDGTHLPSKFSLYQQSVQSPKGDISYLQKFFLTYVGGRAPLHLQEDFCGTALLSTEWLRSDSRRTSIGLDLDVEALDYCMENNVNKIGADISSRIFLYHGNVLQPQEAKLVKSNLQNIMHNATLEENENGSEPVTNYEALPSRDIVCAFNYSCCCLHTRHELVSYFKNALQALSKKGGIFVMDLYGGTSSECELRMQRKFPNFTYTWEQAGFDIVQRKTRISLHYTLHKHQNKKLRHAFSYSWRLWSLPEIKDCLEEAGFRSVHFWIRQMPDSENIKSIQGFGDGKDIKYEEVTSFQQQDSWNAYIVGVS